MNEEDKNEQLQLLRDENESLKVLCREQERMRQKLCVIIGEYREMYISCANQLRAKKHLAPILPPPLFRIESTPNCIKMDC